MTKYDLATHAKYSHVHPKHKIATCLGCPLRHLGSFSDPTDRGDKFHDKKRTWEISWRLAHGSACPVEWAPIRKKRPRSLGVSLTFFLGMYC